MASLGANILPSNWDQQKALLSGLALLFGGLAATSLTTSTLSSPSPSVPTNPTTTTTLRSFLLFFYSCFLKPHAAPASGSQQEALESFYQKQADAYDATRRLLLQGREDLLALLAAQLEAKAIAKAEALAASRSSIRHDGRRTKRIWVDVGGGTGYNIEAMGQFVDVPNFFSSIYLVDFSPSLCKVARRRFERLGWTNVKVVCEDARKFCLEDYESDVPGMRTPVLGPSYFNTPRPESGGADLITMSYSLSMIPDYYSVIDSLSSLLAPNGIMGVVDFYTQSSTDYAFRNFTGGFVDRHVNFFLRVFWRAWFEIDHVNLEAARRDYLEYRFGSVLALNQRNKTLGHIPYYLWIGCQKKPFSASALPHEIIERIDALATESPLLLPRNAGTVLTRAVERSAPEVRSKAWLTAVQNASANLPLPAFFYQNHHWRIYYDDTLQKHRQFNDEYIYAFTWEDTRVDAKMLQLGPQDVVLAITSAGDNILSYALRSPARIHAVDLNPTQNHLLELKVAAYTALPYKDFWALFGEGKHADFRQLLVRKLSPHLSSRAFQYWMANTHVFTSATYGLYDTGGSRHAIRSFRWIARLFGIRGAVAKVLNSATLDEQREIWRQKIRPALVSPLISKLVVSQESFLWSALGVPKNQLAMIEADHAVSEAVTGPKAIARATRSHAIWHYMVNTLDAVAEETHLAGDNPYYYVCMAGKFSPKCHLDYQSPEAHAKLSKSHALDNLRIHTDELEEVIARLSPGTLTVAVVMDSMDWFDPGALAAAQQITKLNRALKMGGRVMLRSSALKPWYIKTFEVHGFSPKRMGARTPGTLIDRVNMYASCWICTKVGNLPPPTPEFDHQIGGLDMPSLAI